MNLVFATAARTCFIDRGWSNASGAGAAPLMARIQPAWRASTAWMDSAETSTTLDFTSGAWPL